jgi:gas vesicle protein
MMQDRSTMMGSTAGYAAVFIAGLAIGTLATGGLLLYMAPTSSKKMRQEATKRARELRDQAYDRADDLKENANDWLSRGRSQGKRWARQTRGMREEAIDSMQDLQKRGERQFKRQSKTAHGVVGAGRRIIDRVLG